MKFERLSRSTGLEFLAGSNSDAELDVQAALHQEMGWGPREPRHTHTDTHAPTRTRTRTHTDARALCEGPPGCDTSLLIIAAERTGSGRARQGSGEAPEGRSRDRRPHHANVKTALVLGTDAMKDQPPFGGPEREPESRGRGEAAWQRSPTHAPRPRASGDRVASGRSRRTARRRCPASTPTAFDGRGGTKWICTIFVQSAYDSGHAWNFVQNCTQNMTKWFKFSCNFVQFVQFCTEITRHAHGRTLYKNCRT